MKDNEVTEIITVTYPGSTTSFEVLVCGKDDRYFNVGSLPRHVLHLISDGDAKYRLGGTTTDGWQWKITMSKKLGIGV